MSRRRLVIEGDDRGQFFLAVEAGAMTLGTSAENAETVLRGLRIARIHCEIEVEDEPVLVGSAAAGGRQALRAGELLQVGRSRLRVEPAGEDEPPAPPSAEVPATVDDTVIEARAHVHLVRRLLVIDGADQGKSFTLPAQGTVSVGNSSKHAGIVLHDLYVARLHCELHVDEDSIVVVHVQGQKGTLINGQLITRQELNIGDVLRAGNSHLRLELVTAEEAAGDEAPQSEEGGYDIVGARVVGQDEDAPVEAEAEEDGEQSHAAIDELLQLEGQTLGHFRIGTLLGRGQSGVVFRSVDNRNNNAVALKVLSPDFPKTEPELQRFARALKAVPQLNHPNLVTVFGAGKTAAYCWIAREHVEGESVARLMQRLREEDKLDWTRACRVALHLGKVLYFLHGHKVTHGNLTPRNVLVRSADRATKLADLMLNQALEGSGLQKAILGRKMLAELPYLAPEQSDPHDPVTPAGDIYALGGVLYGLLTGQPPFQAETPREVRALAREGKVVRPSKLRKGIPAPFEAAVLKMLGRRPEDRFGSAMELLAEVETIAYEHGVTG